MALEDSACVFCLHLFNKACYGPGTFDTSCTFLRKARPDGGARSGCANQIRLFPLPWQKKDTATTKKKDSVRSQSTPWQRPFRILRCVRIVMYTKRVRSLSHFLSLQGQGRPLLVALAVLAEHGAQHLGDRDDGESPAHGGQ